jgi:hypothetical protein
MVCPGCATPEDRQDQADAHELVARHLFGEFDNLTFFWEGDQRTGFNRAAQGRLSPRLPKRQVGVRVALPHPDP